MNSNMGHCRHSEGSAGVCSAGGPHAAHTDVHGARTPRALFSPTCCDSFTETKSGLSQARVRPPVENFVCTHF